MALACGGDTGAARRAYKAAPSCATVWSEVAGATIGLAGPARGEAIPGLVAIAGLDDSSVDTDRTTVETALLWPNGVKEEVRKEELRGIGTKTDAEGDLMGDAVRPCCGIGSKTDAEGDLIGEGVRPCFRESRPCFKELAAEDNIGDRAVPAGKSFDGVDSLSTLSTR